MKTTLVMLLLTLGTLCVGQTAKPAIRDYTSLLLDNIAYVASGEDFASAFAQEPTCSGLTLTLWTHGLPKQLWTTSEWSKLLKAEQTVGWWLQYTNKERDGMLYSGGVLTRDDSPAGDKVSLRDSPDFDIQGKTDRAAARQVCFIMKQKGGQVR